MKINFGLVWLLFAFAFALIHARYVHWSFDNDDFNRNEPRRQLYFHQLPPLMTSKLFNIITSEQYNPYEQDRLSPIARRAKAIVKGDPREFMG